MSEVGIGLVGAGEFAEFCFDGYRRNIDNWRLVGVYDQIQKRAESFSKRFGGQAFRSFEELLDQSTISIVIILTRPVDHFPQAKQALSAGKDILVEKPIATTITQAKELIDLADRQKRQLASNLVLRWHPFHQKLADQARQKTYGHLRQIITTALLAEYPSDHWYWDRSQSGGFFLNTYIHFFDLYRFIFGTGPTGFQTSGDPLAGQTIVVSFPFGQASLNVNLRLTNAQEMVRTTYVFDTATTETEGWFPVSEVIRRRDGRIVGGKPTGARPSAKNFGYQKALSSVLAELILRIKQPSAASIINNQTLLDAVNDALWAEKSLANTGPRPRG